MQPSILLAKIRSRKRNPRTQYFLETIATLRQPFPDETPLMRWLRLEGLAHLGQFLSPDEFNFIRHFQAELNGIRKRMLTQWS